jgi:hypothetical protein
MSGRNPWRKISRKRGPGLLYIQHVRHGVHVWIGPAGLHLYWPDVWASRLDWCRTWREPPK